MIPVTSIHSPLIALLIPVSLSVSITVNFIPVLDSTVTDIPKGSLPIVFDFKSGLSRTFRPLFAETLDPIISSKDSPVTFILPFS